jgi:uncharacterized protein (DUF2147 family)
VKAAHVIFGLVLSAPMGATAAVGAAATGGDLTGRWATPSGGLIEFGTCSSAVREASNCGRIAALGDPSGAERFDTHNPSAGLRRRPVLGLELLSGLQPAGPPRAWTVDALYNPDDGRTYRGTVRLLSDDRLELKGCALAIFCQTQTWRRVR